MRDMLRIVSKGRLRIVAVLAFVTAACWLLLHFCQSYTCDIHDHRSVTSPNGKWTALWKMEGCAGLLLVTNFNSSISIVDNRDTSKSAFQVFNSDGPDPPQLAWNGDDNLSIRIDVVAEVFQSKRDIPGVRITYLASPRLLSSLEYQE